jgi:hypothetical protein
MELELGMSPHPIVIVSLIDKKTNQKELSLENPLAIVKDLDDEQIESLASRTLTSLKFPLDRLPHMVNELKAYRAFYQRCSDQNITILQLKNVAYQMPTRFVLRKKSTGLETPPSSDINSLLIAFGF